MNIFTKKDIENRIESTEIDLKIYRMAYAENEILGKDNAYRTEQIEQTIKLLAFWRTQLELAPA